MAGIFADGFINTTKAKELGIDLDKITSPYHLWNSDLPRDAYYVFLLLEDPKERKKVMNSKLYRSLENNPEFTKRHLASGN